MQRIVFMAEPILMAPHKSGLAPGAAVEVQRENAKGYGELLYLQADWCLYQNISLAFIAKKGPSISSITYFSGLSNYTQNNL